MGLDWWGMRSVGGKAYPACAVPHHEDEAATFAAVGVAFRVEGGETDAVLLDAVSESPVVDELEAGRNEQSDLFCEGSG